MREDPRLLLKKFERSRILVIGDLMVDESLWGHVERISPEAPVPVMRLIRRERTLGGAGNVVKNLASLGACVTMLGAVGTDATGDFILEELDRLGVDHSGVSREPQRTSTLKSRLISLEHGQQVFRFDEETPHCIVTQTEDRLVASLDTKMANVDAILCSDYMKGVLTRRMLQETFGAARRRALPAIVAPKDSDPEKYRSASVLIPNVKELSQLSKIAPNGEGWLAKAANEMMNGLAIGSLLVTRGGGGMSLFDNDGTMVRRVDIPTVARSVYDVTGAGDTVISVFTLAVATGADYETGARLANAAAGIVVSKRGTATLTCDELLALLDENTGSGLAGPGAR